MRLGYACDWRDGARTWSGTPAALLAALQRSMDVVDVGGHMTTAERVLWKAAYSRVARGRLTTRYEQGRAYQKRRLSKIRRDVHNKSVDVVLQVQDLGVLDVPYAVYQDLSYSLLVHERQCAPERFEWSGFAWVDTRSFRQASQRQLTVYEGSQLLFCMSGYLRDHLAQQDGIAPNRLRVLHPGRNSSAVPDEDKMSARLERRRKHVLFVGRDFQRKGGAQVVAAQQLLREGGHDVRLTVAGPPDAEAQHMRGLAGVEWLGDVTQQRVVELLQDCDLLVVPSWFEAFGIIYAEAICLGVPVIARDVQAVREIITPGVHGRLLGADAGSHSELAQLVLASLEDQELFQNCAEAAQVAQAYWTWSRAADDVRKELCSP